MYHHPTAGIYVTRLPLQVAHPLRDFLTPRIVGVAFLDATTWTDVPIPQEVSQGQLVISVMHREWESGEGGVM